MQIYIFGLPWYIYFGSAVKNPPAMQETWVQTLAWEDPLEKGMATHSSVLAWRIPWAHKELDMPERLSLSYFRDSKMNVFMQGTDSQSGVPRPTSLASLKNLLKYAFSGSGPTELETLGMES